jgi:hypothetical protein
MVASYPTTVRDYSARTDLVDIVVADNVNSLQEEVRAIETALGVSSTGTSPLVSTFAGTWSAATTSWGTLGARLLNIEAGLVSGVGANAPYVLKTGGSQVLTATNVGLSLKTGTGTLALLETYTSANVLGFNVTYLGIPRVGTNNVLYVNSTEYGALVTATTNASDSAAGKIPLSTVTTAGDLILGTGNATVGRLGRGSSGQALVMSGTSVVWATPTDTSKLPLSTVTTAGDLIIATGNAAVSRLGIGSNGQVLTSNGTTATWSTPISSYVGQTNGAVTTASTTSGVVRNIWTSTSASPTGGIDGDIWIVYT